MLTSEQQEQKSKQRKIRNSEYYDMVSTFDGLYANSKKGKIFNHLMEIIESEENIKLAYRTIKTNTGSDTAGVDKRTINDLAKLNEEEYVRLIRNVSYKSWSRYARQNSAIILMDSVRIDPLNMPSLSVCD